MKKQAKKIMKQSKLEAIMRDSYTGDDVKRYIGAVTEEFQGHVSAIAEQFLGLNDKIDSVATTLNDKIDTVATTLNDKIDRLEENSNAHTEMIGRLMIDVEDIKVNMREKVSREEFNKLETRLVMLESFVFSTTGKKVGRTK